MSVLRMILSLVLASLSVGIAISTLTAGESAPSFDLPRWSSGERVRLEDFAGQVLVLDFFAYWCAPCERASRELESGVQQFYKARSGNPRAVPVRVLSVNIERDFPDETRKFIERTGASFVVNDPDASLLGHFGNTGIPFLVVIDGTASKPGSPRFDVAYRHAGFEGAARLRRIIDALGAPLADGSRSSVPAPDPGLGSSVAIQHSIELDPEFVWTGDMFITDTRLRYLQEFGDTEWDAAFSYGSFDIDYRPFRTFDFLGYNETVHEDKFAASVSLRQLVAPRLTLIGSGGAYDGYRNYRRVWIANRYQQKYDNPNFPRVPGYEEPNPWGANGSIGARVEYLPTTGFAELTLGYAHDHTAPGYEDGEDANGDYLLLQGLENLETKSLKFSSENVLHRRVRLLNDFRFTDTTERELRFTYQGSINIALGERWVVRGYGGVSTEAPRFNARFYGGTIEFEILPRLLVGATGRYYQDTGELEDALVTSNAAPPLSSWEAGIGIRYSWRRSAFKLYVATFSTDYAPVTAGNAEFFYLYQDRNWGLAQFAWSVQF